MKAADVLLVSCFRDCVINLFTAGYYICRVFARDFTLNYIADTISTFITI